MTNVRLSLGLRPNLYPKKQKNKYSHIKMLALTTPIFSALHPSSMSGVWRNSPLLAALELLLYRLLSHCIQLLRL